MHGTRVSDRQVVPRLTATLALNSEIRNVLSLDFWHQLRIHCGWNRWYANSPTLNPSLSKHAFVKVKVYPLSLATRNFCLYLAGWLAGLLPPFLALPARIREMMLKASKLQPQPQIRAAVSEVACLVLGESTSRNCALTSALDTFDCKTGSFCRVLQSRM